MEGKAKMVSPKYLKINRLRLIIIGVIYNVLNSIFLTKEVIFWWISSLTFAIIFVILYVFYFPCFYRSLRYEINREYIVINYGNIFKNRVYLPKTSVTKITLSQTLLQRLYKVKTVSFSVPGLDIRLYSLDEKMIKDILDQTIISVK